MKSPKLFCLFAMLAVLGLPMQAHASADTLIFRFDTYAGSGLSTDTTGGRLDSRRWAVWGMSDGDTAFEEEWPGGDFARGRSPGRVSTGGMYAFETADGTRLLGFQATGTDMAPGAVLLRLRQDEIPSDHVHIRYMLHTLNDQGRSTAVTLHWSSDGSEWIVLGASRRASPTAGDPAALWHGDLVEAAFTLPGQMDQGDFLYLKWVCEDSGGTGSRDEWGLSEVRVSEAADLGGGPAGPDGGHPSGAENRQILATWSFDADTDSADVVSSDNQDAHFALVGANRSGYAGGSPGRAANSSRWHDEGTQKYWWVRLSTVGFKDLALWSKQVSSATGPGSFTVEWSSDSLSWKTLDQGFVTTSSSFGAGVVDSLSLPASAAELPRLWIRWRGGYPAVNGAGVSATGTSRIDGIRVTGKPSGRPLPLWGPLHLGAVNGSILGSVELVSQGIGRLQEAAVYCRAEGETHIVHHQPVLKARDRVSIHFDDLPRPSAWACWATAVTDLGSASTDTLHLSVPPLPLPYDPVPSRAASDLRLVARTDTSMQVAWQNGDGEYRMLVLQPEESSVCIPDTMATYDQHPHAAKADTLRGGCPVLFSGTASSAVIYGLPPLTETRLSVIEYNGRGGRENYRWQDAPKAVFRTRAAAPAPLSGLRAVDVSGESAMVTWDEPTSGGVRVVAVEAGVDITPHLLDFEEDVYRGRLSPPFERLCHGSPPCVIPLRELSGKTLYGWTVGGPPGHVSAQQERPSSLRLPTVSSEGLLELAAWSFDHGGVLPSSSTWNFADVSVNLVGARERGFAAGHSGQALNADQWDGESTHKGWILRLPTFGLDHVRLSFRLLSSNAGPAEFGVWCGLEPYEMVHEAVGHVAASSTWASSVEHYLELPTQCLEGVAHVRISPKSNRAMNGGVIARNGTVRLDDLRLLGKSAMPVLPVVMPPVAARVDDEGIGLAAELVSNGGSLLSSRFVRWHVGGTSGTMEIDVTQPKLWHGFMDRLQPSSEYVLAHCAGNERGEICSPSISVRTPDAVPDPAKGFSVQPLAPDSVVVYTGGSADGVWLVAGPSWQLTPVGVDSVGLNVGQNQGAFSTRLPAGMSVGLGGFQPGAEYRFWFMAVNGGEGRMRFARGPHPYLDVTMPALPAPLARVDSLHAVSTEVGSFRIQWGSVGDADGYLVTATQSPQEPVLPGYGHFYRPDPALREGELMGGVSWVISTDKTDSLQLDGVNFGESWVVAVFPYALKNGVISYKTDDFASILIHVPALDELPVLSARQYIDSPGISEGFLRGVVISSVGELMWVHTSDGNLVVEDATGTTALPGDSLALWVRKVDQSRRHVVRKAHKIGETKGLPPVEAWPADADLRSVERQARVILGNLLVDRPHPEDPRCHYFQQRGRLRRTVLVCRVSEILAFESDVEVGLRGIPAPGSSETLTVWLDLDESLTAYPVSAAVLSAPANGAVFTWTAAASDTLHLQWEPDLRGRLGDVFPDSAAAAYRLVLRPLGEMAPSVDTLLRAMSLKLPASGLHRRMASVQEDLPLELHVEWGVSALRSPDLLASAPRLDWAQFRLVRLRLAAAPSEETLPERFAVGHPFPNPFNPRTSITVHIPDAGDAQVAVHDVLGRRCAVLHMGYIQPGRHDFVWHAGGFASGIYNIVVRYSGSTSVRPVTLIR